MIYNERLLIKSEAEASGHQVYGNFTIDTALQIVTNDDRFLHYDDCAVRDIYITNKEGVQSVVRFPPGKLVNYV